MKNITAEDINIESSVVLTRAGGYYIKYLTKTLMYCESCMLDTAIDETPVWDALSELTVRIENCHDIVGRMTLRQARLKLFLEHLTKLEEATFHALGNLQLPIGIGNGIMAGALDDVERAVQGQTATMEINAERGSKAR